MKLKAYLLSDRKIVGRPKHSDVARKLIESDA
jgi:hypothetical protein